MIYIYIYIYIHTYIHMCIYMPYAYKSMAKAPMNVLFTETFSFLGNCFLDFRGYSWPVTTLGRCSVLPLDCMGKARVKGVPLSQMPVRLTEMTRANFVLSFHSNVISTCQCICSWRWGNCQYFKAWNFTLNFWTYSWMNYMLNRHLHHKHPSEFNSGQSRETDSAGTKRTLEKTCTNG